MNQRFRVLLTLVVINVYKYGSGRRKLLLAPIVLALVCTCVIPANAIPIHTKVGIDMMVVGPFIPSQLHEVEVTTRLVPLVGASIWSGNQDLAAGIHIGLPRAPGVLVDFSARLLQAPYPELCATIGIAADYPGGLAWGTYGALLWSPYHSSLFEVSIGPALHRIQEKGEDPFSIIYIFLLIRAHVKLF